MIKYGQYTFIPTKKIKKRYIRITSTSVIERWHHGHGYLTKKKDGSFCQPAMAYAILKYEWEGFSHEVVAENLTMEEASQMEKELIEKYQSNNKHYGYNIKEGGINGLPSEESIQKALQTKLKKGYHHSEETKKKISESNIGKTHTDSSKELLSKSHSKTKQRPKENIPRNDIYNQVCCQCVETGECFPSISNAAVNVGSYNSNIVKCLKGTRKRAGGYHWKEITKKEYEEYCANN